MNGLVVSAAGEQAKLAEIDPSDLPDGDITVSVAYSSLNYKDSLAVLSAAPVIRSYPMVPGIDLVGRVSESRSDQFSVGEWVIVNGWGLGETRWGGFAEMARLEEGMPVRLPEGLDPVDAMAIGTAGYTAMLCVLALEERGVSPESGPILVTGATGGVGLVSVMLLSALKYSVIASTGKSEAAETLMELGATEVIGRFEQGDLKPLGKERWAGVIDSVGSIALAAALSGTHRNGTVVACGLAQGMDLPATVAPFILRGVSLIGIDSVYQSRDRREKAWTRLARHLDLERFRTHTSLVGLGEVPAIAEKQLAGALTGRVIVRCQTELSEVSL